MVVVPPGFSITCSITLSLCLKKLLHLSGVCKWLAWSCWRSTGRTSILLPCVPVLWQGLGAFWRAWSLPANMGNWIKAMRLQGEQGMWPPWSLLSWGQGTAPLPWPQGWQWVGPPAEGKPHFVSSQLGVPGWESSLGSWLPSFPFSHLHQAAFHGTVSAFPCPCWAQHRHPLGKVGFGLCQ